MKVAAVDIGSNSVRLLIVDGRSEIFRGSEVTGLGRGVAATGLLSEEAVEQTIAALRKFRRVIDEAGVERCAAVTTAAARMASNTDVLLDAAEEALGYRPEVVSGVAEAGLSYAGATAGLSGDGWVVVDIGGASTEFITADDAVSLGIGSVRLTEEFLVERPVDPTRLEVARRLAREVMADVGRVVHPVIGVAGTWTSLAAILNESDASVHGRRLTRDSLDALAGRLAPMSVEATADLPGLDPARAPVILGGAIIAQVALEALGASEATVSINDLLDGLVAQQIAT